MDYFETIGKCIDYIEQHLTDELTLNDISHEGYISIPHLYRIFPAMTGCTVGEYIRKRRLTEAVGALYGNRIIDIAVEYQFKSQESFIRAFKVMFGVTPGEYRKQRLLIPLFHRVHLDEEKRKGDFIMQPDIIKRKFTLAGLVTEVDLSTDFVCVIESVMVKVRQHISDIQNPVLPIRLINFWYPEFDQNTNMSEPKTMFFTGIEVQPVELIPEVFVMMNLPDSLYAVFKENTRGTIGGAEGYAYRTWLASSGYQLNEKIPGDLEIYQDTIRTGYADECKILIPISL